MDLLRLLLCSAWVVALASCSTLPILGPTEDPTTTPAALKILNAEASLHRVATEDGGDDFAEEEYFILRTMCRLRVENRSGKTQQVMSFFGSAYDDLRLRVRNESGQRLATTTHTLWVTPLLEGQWFPLPEGASVVELSCATLVGAPLPDDDLPVISPSQLTQTIQLEYFGGFPGSDFTRAFQSDSITVKISDRTAEVPRRSVPVPQDHV